MGFVTIGAQKSSISGKRKGFFHRSSIVRHDTEWPVSDHSTDLIIEVGTSNFSLHEFPLASRCGRIRKLLLESKDSKDPRLNLPAVPGGAEAFELAAKFCYGKNVEITLSNVAMLCCVANYLEMTEDLAKKNLESQVEVYLKNIVLPNMSNSIAVLHQSESLLPVSEDINLVHRLINAIANNACKEQLASGSSKPICSFSGNAIQGIEAATESEWWGKSLAVLKPDLLQRVLSAAKSKGLRQNMINVILMNHAQSSLQGLLASEQCLGKGYTLDLESRQKLRDIVEAIVGLLPPPSRKCSFPIPFLSKLLKIAIAASSSTSCRSDLERRIGLQLDKAILRDILIPVSPRGNNHDAIYDTESLLRIFSAFLDSDEEDDEEDWLRDESEMVYDFNSSRRSSLLKVSSLLDHCLSELALDSCLSPCKFISLAELLPDHARIVSDGLYQAVDIFLKVHPNVKDSVRYRLCKTIDCQKLSQEACNHAAQNERLSVQMVIQVLYFEQIRLRNAMNNGNNELFFGEIQGQFPQFGNKARGCAISSRDNYALMRIENRELKLEVSRMKMRLTNLEKDHFSMKRDLKKCHSANKLFKSLSRKLSKLNSLFLLSGIKPRGGRANSESRCFHQGRRRHSIP